MNKALPHTSTTAARLTALAAALLLAACSSTQPAPVVKTETQPGGNTATSSSGGDTGTVKPTTTTAADPLKDPNNILSKRSVFFDYDKYDIREDQRKVVEAHGKFLAANAGRSIRIEGNADDCGSREYNLALGQMRAEAVRKALTVLGAQDKQIEAVSRGEENPKATGATEDAYAQNRRGDIVYNGE